MYLQVLEGERSQVNALYARIALDKRHHRVVPHQLESISRRRYGKWAMAHVDMGQLSDEEAAHTQGTAFDPYTATAEEVMAKIDALIAAGKVMNAPVI